MRGTVAKRIHSMMESAGPTLTWPKARVMWNQFCGRTGPQLKFPARRHPGKSRFMGFRGVGQPKREWDCNAPVYIRNHLGGIKGSECARKNRGHKGKPAPYAAQIPLGNSGLISRIVQAVMERGIATIARLFGRRRVI